MSINKPIRSYDWRPDIVLNFKLSRKQVTKEKNIKGKTTRTFAYHNYYDTKDHFRIQYFTDGTFCVYEKLCDGYKFLTTQLLWVGYFECRKLVRTSYRDIEEILKVGFQNLKLTKAGEEFVKNGILSRDDIMDAYKKCVKLEIKDNVKNLKKRIVEFENGYYDRALRIRNELLSAIDSDEKSKPKEKYQMMKDTIGDRKIRLRFTEEFDMTVPDRFVFLCELPAEYKKSNRNHVEYAHCTLTAEQILNHWYHPETRLIIRQDYNGTFKFAVPLNLIDCEYVDE